jgi:hypothetical protein
MSLTPREVRSLTTSIGELRKDNHRIIGALLSSGYKECRVCKSLDARTTIAHEIRLHQPAHLSFGSRHWCIECLLNDEDIFDRNDQELDHFFRGRPIDIAQAIQPFAETLLDYHYVYNLEGEGAQNRAAVIARRILGEEEDRARRNHPRFLPCRSPISAWEMFMDVLRDNGNYEAVIDMLGRFGGRVRSISHIQSLSPVWNHRAYHVLGREENLRLANAIRKQEDELRNPERAVPAALA